MLYPIFSKSSSLRDSLRSEDFSSEPSSSSNKSPPMFVDSYTVLLSSMFIMCNTQRKQLWTMVDFPECNPNKATSVITSITINRHVKIVWWQGSRRYPSASMLIAQSSKSRLSPSTKKEIMILVCMHPLNFCNSCNMRIMCKLVLLPMNFPN